MKRRSFQKRVLFPVFAVFFLMLTSLAGYFGSGYIENYYIRRIIAGFSGAIYFISITFGPFYVYTIGYIRGASMLERVAASMATPLAWMTKETIRLTESHPVVECVYYYLNPLNFWLVSFAIFEMGVATLVARHILKRRGQYDDVFSPAPIAVILASIFVVISAYAWGKGEGLYVIFLEGYRLIFGSGL